MSQILLLSDLLNNHFCIIYNKSIMFKNIVLFYTVQNTTIEVRNQFHSSMTKRYEFGIQNVRQFICGAHTNTYSCFRSLSEYWLLPRYRFYITLLHFIIKRLSRILTRGSGYLFLIQHFVRKHPCLYNSIIILFTLGCLPFVKRYIKEKV